jgi:hypothetical protein
MSKPRGASTEASRCDGGAAEGLSGESKPLGARRDDGSVRESVTVQASFAVGPLGAVSVRSKGPGRNRSALTA